MLPGLRVVRELDALIEARGRPAMIVSDNGTELTGMAILRWSAGGLWIAEDLECCAS
jgi:putative transposase